MRIRIDRHGVVTYVYRDDYDLTGEGAGKVERASSVEPGEDNRWYVRLKILDSVTVGPFVKRGQAISWEVKKLEDSFVQT